MLFSCLIWLIWFWNSGQIRWLKLSEKSVCRTVGEAGRSLTGFCLSSSYLRPVKSPDTSRDLCLYVYHLDMWTIKPSWANKVPPIWSTHALSPRTSWFLSRLFSTDPFATYWSPLPGPPYSPARLHPHIRSPRLQRQQTYTWRWKKSKHTGIVWRHAK